MKFIVLKCSHFVDWIERNATAVLIATVVVLYVAAAIGIAVVALAANRHWKCDWAYDFVWLVIPGGFRFIYDLSQAHTDQLQRGRDRRWERNKARCDPWRRGQRLP